MKALFVVLILTSCMLFEIDWIICDWIYPNVGTPWHVLRNEFESTEMFLALTALIFALKNFANFFKWEYFYKDVEHDLKTRIVIAYWQFSFGDVIDRIFFDVNELNWNDGFVYLYVAYYLFKTIKQYVVSIR